MKISQKSIGSQAGAGMHHTAIYWVESYDFSGSRILSKTQHPALHAVNARINPFRLMSSVMSLKVLTLWFKYSL